MRQGGSWFKAWLASVWLAALPAAAATPALFDETPGLAWSELEVDALARPGFAAALDQAARAGRSGCESRCAQIERVFRRLQQAVLDQGGRAGRIAWRLVIVREPGLEAFATPEGEIVLSEFFVEQRAASDAMLAFVLAHEMAHSILQHERQALTGVLALLPRGIARTARDVAVELDYSGAMRALAAPLFQQTEFDADEQGLLLAAAAGFHPGEALAFMEAERRLETRPPGWASTHPAAAARLAALQQRLPLALRVWEAGSWARSESLASSAASRSLPR